MIEKLKDKELRKNLMEQQQSSLKSKAESLIFAKKVLTVEEY